MKQRKKTMKPVTKKILLFAGLFALLIHFTLVLLQQASFLSDKHKLYYLVRGYGNFFHQSWNVFVPPPDTNYKLFVRVEENGIRTKEIFQDMLTQHQANRLNGCGPLITALSNCIYGFEKGTALQLPLNGPIRNDVNFLMIEQAAKSYVNNTYHTQIKTPRLILLVEQVDSKQQRVYFN